METINIILICLIVVFYILLIWLGLTNKGLGAFCIAFLLAITIILGYNLGNKNASIRALKNESNDYEINIVKTYVNDSVINIDTTYIKR